MLKSTPNIDYNSTVKTGATKPKPDHKVSFYADCPDGERNKLHNYLIYDLSHAIDLLGRFKKKGYTIRAAYFKFPDDKQIRIPL
jgi:hypothetical protein